MTPVARVWIRLGNNRRMQCWHKSPHTVCIYGLLGASEAHISASVFNFIKACSIHEDPSFRAGNGRAVLWVTA